MFSCFLPTTLPISRSQTCSPGLTCVKRFNQQYSSYSHEYPVDSVTVSYYDDAENNNLLFTVYPDGTAIVNSQFVKIKAPKGGAEEVYRELAEIVK